MNDSRAFDFRYGQGKLEGSRMGSTNGKPGTHYTGTNRERRPVLGKE